MLKILMTIKHPKQTDQDIVFMNMIKNVDLNPAVRHQDEDSGVQKFVVSIELEPDRVGAPCLLCFMLS